MVLVPLVVLLVLSVSPAAALAEETPPRWVEHLYHLTKFVEWPDHAFSGPAAPLTICFEGERRVADVRGLESRTSRGRRIAVRSGRRSGGCNIVVYADAPSVAPGDARAVRSEVLTVGRGRDFVRSGGMVAFVDGEGDELRLAVNPDAADRGGLRVSSRLLRVADIVSSAEVERR